MKIALFGRTIESESMGELALLVDKILHKSEVVPVIYREFADYLSEKIGLCEFAESDRAKISALLSKAVFFESYRTLPDDTDLFMSLGGDGTFLSSVALVRDKNIPIVGVNFGRLGFLTTAKVHNGADEAADPECNNWIDALLAGNFTIEERSLLKLEYQNAPADFYPCALNEFSIQRNGPAVLEMKISINGAEIPRYMADGVLVASATGSTAYSMSAGGPIVMPDGKVLIIVPVAPHNLNIRPLVVPDDSIIEVSFTTRYDNATLSADNRSITIPNGTSVKITRAGNAVKLVSVNGNFVKALSEKLFWGADWRNSHNNG